jgi:transposase
MKKYRLIIGIDVSKSKLDVCVIADPTSKQHAYSVVENNVKGIKQMLAMVLRHGIVMEEVLFCLENTGIYSMPLACHLSSIKADFWVVPAMEIKRSKGISRGKSDKIDARDIAYYAYTHQHKLKLYQLPEIDLLKLKLLQTEREKFLKALLALKTSEENEAFLPKEVVREIRKANTMAQKALEKSLSLVEERIKVIIEQHPILQKQYQLITSVPGVGPRTAVYLITVTRCFKDFASWRKLACYAGIAPFEYTSGSSVRGKTKVNHLADKKLKSLLNMCALNAKRVDKELGDYYRRKTSEGKNKMLVLNAVRCKVLSRVFAIINRDTPFVNTQKFAA